MQVYKQISNPYMPNGTPDKTNAPSPYYAPGELGCTFTDQNTGKTYLRVQVDSGATSSTSVGAIVSGQLAYWKSFSLALVTNDPKQCDYGPSGAPNRVAGVFVQVPTVSPNVNGPDGQPQLYMTDLLIQGLGTVQVNGTITQGGPATADTTANTARMISNTVATAPPTQLLGYFTSATVTNNTAQCNVNIAFLD